MTLLCHLVVVGVLHDGGAGHLHDAAARPLGLADEVAIGEGAEEAHAVLDGTLQGVGRTGLPPAGADDSGRDGRAGSHRGRDEGGHGGGRGAHDLTIGAGGTAAAFDVAAAASAAATIIVATAAIAATASTAASSTAVTFGFFWVLTGAMMERSMASRVHHISDPVPPHQSPATGDLFHVGGTGVGRRPQGDDAGRILRDGGPTKLEEAGWCGRPDAALGADGGGGEEGRSDGHGRRGDEALVSSHGCPSGLVCL